MATRTKRSSLRDRHQQTTRGVILDALVAQLGETGAFDLTYFELARRSGVSVRTIYRHFPTRGDLLDALSQRVNTVMAIAEYPKQREGVVALVRALFPSFDQHAALITAQIQAGLGGRMRTKARHKRVGLVDAAFAATMPHVPVARRRAAAGVVTCLLSANTWQRLRDEVGLDGTQSGEITGWAIETLWRALEVEDRKLR